MNGSASGPTGTGATPETSVPEPGSGRVVVGIDGSVGSLEALRSAAATAQRRQVLLSAISAWDERVPLAAGPADEAAARATLADAARAVFGGDPPPWFRPSVVHGSPQQVLRSASVGAQMLFVGQEGRGHAATGSVSSTIAVASACPVRIVHLPGPEGPAPSTRQGDVKDGQHVRR